jgi:hypothetical protein
LRGVDTDRELVDRDVVGVLLLTHGNHPNARASTEALTLSGEEKLHAAGPGARPRIIAIPTSIGG